MLHWVMDFATLIFFKIPLALLLLYIGSSFFSSWFGGPIWLWMIGLSVFGIIYVKEDLDRAKLEKQQESDA